MQFSCGTKLRVFVVGFGQKVKCAITRGSVMVCFGCAHECENRATPNRCLMICLRVTGKKGPLFCCKEIATSVNVAGVFAWYFCEDKVLFIISNVERFFSQEPTKSGCAKVYRSLSFDFISMQTKQICCLKTMLLNSVFEGIFAHWMIMIQWLCREADTRSRKTNTKIVWRNTFNEI